MPHNGLSGHFVAVLFLCPVLLPLCSCVQSSRGKSYLSISFFVVSYHTGGTGLNNVLRMSVTSLAYLSSPCAKHSGKVEFLQDHFIFDHPNSYLRMPTKEKFYEYVRNATHGKKCYVIQGSRKMFLTVPAKVFHCFDADRQ